MKKLLFIFLFIAQISFASELKQITPESYIAENPTAERIDIVNFLQQQFDNYQNITITQDKLEPIWNPNEDPRSIMRFQIIDQKLYADINKKTFLHTQDFPKIIKYLQGILDKYKVNDVDFILMHAENVTKFSDLLLDFPIFIMSKNNSPANQNLFLFPDYYMMDSWNQLVDKIENANLNNSWDNKSEIIFWRGLTTGAISLITKKDYYNLKVFDKFPRLALVMLSKLYPDLIDAKFSYYVGISEDSTQKDLQMIFDKLNMVSNNYVDEKNHLSYKYLISIDGGTCAWKRVPWIMLSNSVLLKQETNLMQWFYPALKPYKNYVPVDERLTNIFAQLEWMKNNDQEVRKISQNAQNFIKNDLMPTNIEAHIAIILNEYHKLHGDIKIIPTLPTAEEALKIAYEKHELEREQRKGKFVQFRNKLRKWAREFWADI